MRKILPARTPSHTVLTIQSARLAFEGQSRYTPGGREEQECIRIPKRKGIKILSIKNTIPYLRVRMKLRAKIFRTEVISTQIGTFAFST